MEPAKNIESGWRGSPELWLSAAYDALIDSGIDAVRILPLAKALNLSRTSFYWFFDDREILLNALLEQWKEKNTGALIKQSKAYAETICEAVLNVFDCWFDKSLFDPQFEFAVRSWGLQSPNVESELQLADEKRLIALREMFEHFGYETAIADVRARTLYLVQMGYISLRTSEDQTTRFARIAQYVETFTGQAPQQRELDRFFARHAVNLFE